MQINTYKESRGHSKTGEKVEVNKQSRAIPDGESRQDAQLILSRTED